MKGFGNPYVIRLRTWVRHLGLNKVIRLQPRRSGKAYEARFRQQLLETISEGDCVWDVGANVGFYSRLFAEKVGSSGIVYAFEPSLRNRERFSTLDIPDTVSVLPLALGDQDGRTAFVEGSDNLGTTSHIERTPGNSVASYEVEIHRGDTLIVESGIRKPNVLKIDVEGNEWEVLIGLKETLMDPALRVVGIEVHFGLLESRGLQDVPSRIEKLLTRSGLSYGWSDWSHLVARRS